MKDIFYPRLNEFERSEDPSRTLDLGRKRKVEEWINKYTKYTKYKINSDWTIDVRELVIPSQRYWDFKEIPEYVDFGVCYGSVIIRDQNLMSMKGLPKVVKGDFFVNNNKLEDLEGCPKRSMGIFIFEEIRKNLLSMKLKKSVPLADVSSYDSKGIHKF